MTSQTQGRDALVAQLRTLLLLTNTEIGIATLRQAQARTDAVRDELVRNARDGGTRAHRIEVTLRRLGGVPDVVTPAVGRLGALLSTVAAQAEPLPEALLDDLMVEHQLVDRALYLKACASAAGEQDVVRLAELLVAAHSETVEWITGVLAQDAVGAPAALAPTPLQTAAGVAARVAGAPLRWGAAGVDQAVARTRRLGRDVGEDVSDAAAELSQRVAVATGALDERDLPLPDYDALTATQAASRTKDLDPAGLRAVLSYEQAHKDRGTVTTALERRLAARSAPTP